MKHFTTMLFMTFALGAYAQEMVYEDDFSWLNEETITSQENLYDTSEETNNKFLPSVISDKGIQNPGWQQGVFDLNDTHTLRLAPDGDKSPEDFFAFPYNSVWMRPGYLKIGYTNFAGALITPVFEKIGDRTVDLEVTLKMCGYTSAGSVEAPGSKDAANVYIGLWDGSDGEVEDADYEQTASGWKYKCKAIKVTNYHHSKYLEYGPNYDPWDDKISLYTVKIAGATMKTRLYIFGGGYGTEIKGRTTPSTIEEIINGEPKTFTYKPNINRIGLKGCWAKVTREISGIDAVEMDENVNAPVEYFNMQGVRVAEPQKGGLYIRRQGTSATKIVF